MASDFFLFELSFQDCPCKGGDPFKTFHKGEDVHTMCQYCGTDTDKCGVVSGQNLTDTEKENVLEYHNFIRRRVAKGFEPRAPSASNMNKLVWDEDLALVAQRWGACFFYSRRDDERSRDYHTALNCVAFSLFERTWNFLQGVPSLDAWQFVSNKNDI